MLLDSFYRYTPPRIRVLASGFCLMFGVDVGLNDELSIYITVNEKAIAP